MSYDTARATERRRCLAEIEAELKTVEKKLHWQRQGNYWRAILACRYLTSPRSKTAIPSSRGRRRPSNAYEA
jgi:hypothetical protein